ncbi:MAG: phytanoyl-CoA dioxygenase family protein [Spirochaetia bacterium]|nr:phytanoyl-CoA dioxygenase family protein [Spirochaetia bacterium]
MKTLEQPTGLNASQIAAFEKDGYLILRSFLSREEVSEIRALMDEIVRAGKVPGYFEPVSESEAKGDPLKIFPRIIQPHRFNETAKHYFLLPKLRPILETLMGEEPIGAQSMIYFKPPGGRGQAMHQDNLYLRVKPGTCTAFWVAVDDVDQENGGLKVVPGSHSLDVLCPQKSDPTLSFSAEEVAIPAGMRAVPADLRSGDVMFFGGSLLHGSPPNTSNDRFRRSFICHYFPKSTAEASQWYKPCFRFSGEEFQVGVNEGGGPCGTEWTTSYH